MEASKDQAMSLVKKISNNNLLIAGRGLLSVMILLLTLAAIACSSGSDNESRAYQNPAMSNSNQNNSNVTVGNSSEPAQSAQAANENRQPSAPQPLPATTASSNASGEQPPVRQNRNEQPKVSKVEASIAGTWQSPVGRVTVAQNGSTVSATVYYLDGSGTGTINGKLSGRALSFKVSDKSGRSFNGTGSAQVSPDGRAISGRVRLSDGRSQPFVLSR